MSNQSARPDPDQLLKHVQAEEQQQAHGKLKIFLGYVAGVGKTYAMLEAAHQRRAQGIDTVIGYIETHKRIETESLVAGLEVVPRKLTDYHGVTIEEFDLDATLARKPQLVLVDEFAHTNAPGSRHPKRHQDVEELLAAGIDVYTTLNIQHLESLNDVVAQITSVIVRETIPDKILDEAHEIQFIDLPPAELIQRLNEGKVYISDQAARAIQNFFRPGNLTALREMALRRAAERVDDQMRAYMQLRAIPGPWHASERLLVCISGNPLGERLVRTARRLADELNAEWFVVYINVGKEDRERVAATLKLAEELGGKSVMLSGQSAVDAALDYARKHNITKIIAGKPVRSRWLEALRGSFVDEIIRKSGTIDIYVISNSSGSQIEPVKIEPNWRTWLPHAPYDRYLKSVALVMLATLIGFIMDPAVSLEKWILFTRLISTGTRYTSSILDNAPNLDPINLSMIYLAVVVIIALRLGRGPAVVAAILGGLAFDFFFIKPYITFVINDSQYIIAFFVLLIIGLVISQLTSQVKEQSEAAQRREALTASLYDFSRDLASALTIEEITHATVQHLSANFSREVIVLIPKNDKLVVHAHTPDIKLTDEDLAVAMWAYQKGQPAGRDTDTLTASRMRYLPFKASRKIVGVLGVMPHSQMSNLTPEQRQQMETFANQAALAIERIQFAEEARKSQVLQTTEKLQTALLNSISHDLRTPLVSITGALSALQDEQTSLDPDSRRSLVDNAHDEAERLNRLVGNLLDMTRLEAGAFKVTRQLGDLQDVIGSALDQVTQRIGNRQINVTIADGAPLVPMDFVLIVQVIVNILDNALKYSPANTPVELQVQQVNAFVEIKVADQGVGIPEDDLAHIFNKFYRVQSPVSFNGTGLGLAICKGIVELHNGFIVAENRLGGGTVITIRLPI